jgi:hypothetical protein
LHRISTVVVAGAIGFGFTLGLVVTYSLADSGRRNAPARLFDFESSSLDVRPPHGVHASSGFRLASLEMPNGSDFSVGNTDRPVRADRSTGDPSFLGARPDSFVERFAGKAASSDTTAQPLAPPRPASETANGQSTPKSAPPPPIASTAKKPVRSASLSQDVGSLHNADTHTAIYDISARTVYMPNGRKLEAHSGLGEFMDDPRYINVRAKGPTPPNVYDLTLREKLFHGVRAIRLTPVDESKMYGRDGILAHTYMLGANGQSNGCVSFSDYDAFLQAYLRGEVTRIVVVDHLSSAPPPETVSGWETIKNLFTRS